MNPTQVSFKSVSLKSVNTEDVVQAATSSTQEAPHQSSSFRLTERRNMRPRCRAGHRVGESRHPKSAAGRPGSGFDSIRQQASGATASHDSTELLIWLPMGAFAGRSDAMTSCDGASCVTISVDGRRTTYGACIKVCRLKPTKVSPRP